MSKLRALVALCALACGGTGCASRPPTPTAKDITVAAIVVVDQALAVAIDLAPADAGTDPVWEQRVAALEGAAKLVKTTQDVCQVLPTLTTVSEGIHCTECLKTIQTTREQLSCQP